MNIESLRKIMDDKRKSSSENLTLGKLDSKLNLFQDNEKFTLSNGRFLNGDFDSYRGYYEDIYFGVGIEDKKINTISQLKKMILDAYDQAIMIGYKGGEYEIDVNTLIWVAYYGSCGEMFTDIQKINGTITLIIKKEK